MLCGRLLALSLAVGVVVAWWSWPFRRRPGDGRTPRVRAPYALELGTYGLLLTLFVGLWVVGFRQHLSLARLPWRAPE